MTSLPSAAPASGLDAASLAQLVAGHGHLVDHMVRQVSGKLAGQVPWADMVAAGQAGLAQAASGFDPGLGVPFAAWAAPKVRAAVVECVQQGAHRSDGQVSFPQMGDAGQGVPEQLRPVVAWRSDTLDAVIGVAGNPAVSTMGSPTMVAQTRHVAECLDQLPADQAQLVRWLVVEHRPAEYVAAQLGIPVEEVAPLRAAALAALNQLLATHTPGLRPNGTTGAGGAGIVVDDVSAGKAREAFARPGRFGRFLGQ